RRWPPGAAPWPRSWPNAGPRRASPRPRSPQGWGRRSRRWRVWSPGRPMYGCRPSNATRPRWAPGSTGAWRVTGADRGARRAVCVGRVEGVALGVLAACDERRGSPNARFRLTMPRESFEAGPGSGEARLAWYQQRVERFVARLAVATRRPAERISEAMTEGR